MKHIQVENASLEELVNEINEIVRQALKSANYSTRKEPDKVLTREEAKKLLKVSYVTLHKWNKLEILPAYNIGTRVYYHYKDVQNAMKRVA